MAWASGDLFTIEVDSDSFLGYVTGHIVDTLEKAQIRKDQHRQCRERKAWSRQSRLWLWNESKQRV